MKNLEQSDEILVVITENISMTTQHLLAKIKHVWDPFMSY